MEPPKLRSPRPRSGRSHRPHDNKWTKPNATSRNDYISTKQDSNRPRMGRRTHGTKRYKMQNSQERRPWIRPPPDHHDTQPKTRNKHTDSYIQLRQDGLEQDEGQAGRIPPKNHHREYPTNTDIGRST